MDIRTDRLVLRPFLRADLEAFVAYRSDPEVARYQSWDAPYSMAEAEEFLADVVAAPQPGRWLQLAIEERASAALCGDCGIRIAEDQPGTAEIGITLVRNFHGRGIAVEAVGAVLDRLFGELDMHRVYAHADDRNHAVHHLLERLGFRLEARLVEADWFKGEWTTLRIYAILRREWEGRANPNR